MHIAKGCCPFLIFISLCFILQIDLMISGKQPVKAMTYIADLKLFWAVFSIPTDFEPSIPEEYDR